MTGERLRIGEEWHDAGDRHCLACYGDYPRACKRCGGLVHRGIWDVYYDGEEAPGGSVLCLHLACDRCGWEG